MSQQSLGAAALVLNFVSGVASVVGIAIPYWHYTSINGQTVSSGLWQLCAKARGESACVSWVLVSDTLKAVRALEIIGLLLIAGAGLLGILKMTAMKNQNMFFKLAGAGSVAAGIFMIIGTIVYGAKFPTLYVNTVAMHLFVGFGLCIVAGVLSLITGALYIVADQKQTQNNPAMTATYGKA